MNYPCYVLSDFPFTIEGTPEIKSYVIVDCAHLDHTFYREARKYKSLKAESLFSGSPDEESAFAGPLLVELTSPHNREFINQIHTIEKEFPAVLWLWSEQQFDPLLKNLQVLLQGKLENGKRLVTRYYDPRCLDPLLKIYLTDQKTRPIIEQIFSWAYFVDEQKYRYISEYYKKVT